MLHSTPAITRGSYGQQFLYSELCHPQITPASLGLVDSGEYMNTAGGFAFGAHGGVDSSDLDFKSPAWLEALESFDAESFEGEMCRSRVVSGALSECSRSEELFSVD